MMRLIHSIRSIKQCIFPSRRDLGNCGKTFRIGKPIYVSSPKNLHIGDYAVLRRGATILNNIGENVDIRKYTVISANCTIVTNNHKSTVGIPQCLLGASHINDKSQDVLVGEDVWVGVNVTILMGANIGRGCVIGACSTVTKNIPPYAVVVGTPARIVGVKFSVEQILEHEKMLYPENERYTHEYVENLFEEHYKDLKIFGISTDFTEDHLSMLEEALYIREYEMPEYINKVNEKLH